MNVKNLAGLVGSPCFIPFSMAHAAVSPKELVAGYHEPACMRFINSISATGTPYASRVRIHICRRESCVEVQLHDDNSSPLPFPLLQHLCLSEDLLSCTSPPPTPFLAVVPHPNLLK